MKGEVQKMKPALGDIVLFNKLGAGTAKEWLAAFVTREPNEQGKFHVNAFSPFSGTALCDVLSTADEGSTWRWPPKEEP